MNRSHAIHIETWDSLLDHWHQTDYPLQWDCLFVLPSWLKVWWHHFGNGCEPYIVSIRNNDRPIGVAPLWTRGKTARLVGEGSVCDYLDFVVEPDKAHAFYHLLLDHLKRKGIERLALNQLRPDSSVLAYLIPVAEKMGCQISFESSDQSFALDLPGSWDNYLNVLTGKERHEIRRKFRRLHEAGQINYRTVDDVTAVQNEMETFLTLFKSNRPDKSAFMTGQMDSYFRDLALAMARDRIVKLSFLEMDGKPIAAVMCFDYQSTMYLYNNGYDKNYRSLSIGMLCKVLSIKESIQSGKKTYDLLKGSEPYKHRLGGKPIPLYRCDIVI